MSVAEFLVELLTASTGIVTALAWPSVVLIIFLVCMYRFGFLFQRQNVRKRGFLSLRQVESLLDQMENQCVVQGRLSNSDRQRIQLIQYHVRTARAALADGDEDPLLNSLVALSSLAASSDRHLKQSTLPDPGEQPSVLNADSSST